MFNIGVTNTSVVQVAPTPTNYKLCAFYNLAFYDYLLIPCEGGPVTGRYVVLQLLATNFLHMCHFQVIPSKFRLFSLDWYLKKGHYKYVLYLTILTWMQI
jgi:hypothetical protein